MSQTVLNAVSSIGPLHLMSDRTGKADAYALEPLSERHAEIHRGSQRRCIGQLEEAGYTSAIVITEPDPNRPLQSGGVHIHPQKPFAPLNCRCGAARQSGPLPTEQKLIGVEVTDLGPERLYGDMLS